MELDEFWNRDIKFLPGIGEKKALAITKELDIRTFRDMLHFYPYRYMDRTRIYAIREVADESLPYIQIKARVENAQLLGSGFKNRFVVSVSDTTGRAEMIWFNRIEWVSKKIEIGREYLFFGKPTLFNGQMSIVHPEFDIPLAEKTLLKLGLLGVYPSTEKLNRAGAGSKVISLALRELLHKCYHLIEETLPDWLLAKYKLMPLGSALLNVHFPQNVEFLKAAQYRIKFEELLSMQLTILRSRGERVKTYHPIMFDKIGENFNTFYQDILPFPLTEAQKRVVREIRSDTNIHKQMNRLLQGDVGSGKTIVALLAMLIAIDNGYQCSLIAPTEILATQHLESISSLVEKLNLNVQLLTGSTPKRKRTLIDKELRSGEINILISTHAAMENSVVFNNIGLVIIDEQHRFGVEQRSRMWRKNKIPPHVLVMSATPIPRTLAMTLYGDLDLSIIDELPPGRKPIKTIHMFDARREELFGMMRREIAAGRQVYVVYPMIKESESMDYKNLEEGYESITRAFAMPQYNISIVHGKMKPADKEFGMSQFALGRAQIMVATTVIEVGVNVPNATMMVIESAERFGLSQLHQLRGRVGRGAEQSYCVLVSSHKLSSDSRKRLGAMVETNDGFELAELDLKLRGYGDLDGTQQSGDAIELRMASVAKDNDLMIKIREVAIRILEEDPMLEAPKNAKLREMIYKERRDETVDFSTIS
ncbi:MAG: ATP-dependent DNA helicase RecG [Rikenellaceae bacterium]